MRETYAVKPGQEILWAPIGYDSGGNMICKPATFTMTTERKDDHYIVRATLAPLLRRARGRKNPE